MISYVQGLTQLGFASRSKSLDVDASLFKCNSIASVSYFEKSRYKLGTIVNYIELRTSSRNSFFVSLLLLLDIIGQLFWSRVSEGFRNLLEWLENCKIKNCKFTNMNLNQLFVWNMITKNLPTSSEVPTRPMACVVFECSKNFS